MVQSLHQAGIRVIMDVVYNHVYDYINHPLQLTVPNYYFRRDPDGTISNGTGVGNDTASERKMMREY
ncbi:type I pullulanase, partial [Corynebacterium sp. UMB6689]|nr:type I pullulanase [Corynebacterium sp. UMB6689]